ncbi:MAG: hypothetical protein HY515_02655 [Candidatus Aenigmarchaeota archaeon]|nr:hypothetical protein [Candidatus Aenigmarchaeota archaeon]
MYTPLLKGRNLGFLVAKNHASLQLLLNDWFVQDLFFEGGPDLIAIRNHELVKVKVRYATKSDTGYVFSAGGQQKNSFYELAKGSDFLVFVCMDKNEPAGFYIFPYDKTPKTKSFLHPKNGPFPKYKKFYDNWETLQ